MIIDAHAHIMPQRRLDGLSIWLGRFFPTHPLVGKRLTEYEIIRELEAQGVHYIFNYVFPMKASETEGLNLFNARLSEKFKSIIPFGSIHAENADMAGIIKRCIQELNLFGFKLHPYVQGFSPDDERLLPAYAIMEEFGKPIIIHTGFEKVYPKRKKTITLEMVEGLIKSFPNLTFIFPHMFYPKLNDAGYLLEKYKNIYIDTTNVFSAILQDEKAGTQRIEEKEILMNILNQWRDRMIWGTDHPAGMSDIKTIFRDFFSFKMKETIKHDLLYRTAYKFIKKYGNRDFAELQCSLPR